MQIVVPTTPAKKEHPMISSNFFSSNLRISIVTYTNNFKKNNIQHKKNETADCMNNGISIVVYIACSITKHTRCLKISRLKFSLQPFSYQWCVIRSSGGQSPLVTPIFDFIPSFLVLLKVEILFFQFKLF